MGLPEDLVIINQAENPKDPSVITINCPDKTGLGCDLCRIILLFGLSIVRGDVSTDGKWCYLLFWVVGRANPRWDLLKERLVEACPSSCVLASRIFYYRAELQQPRPPDVFLLKFSGFDQKGLLHDVTEVLCELELTIKRVKVSTTPDGKVMDLFFVTDTRELLHTAQRKDDICDRLRSVLGDVMLSCEIEWVSHEVSVSSQTNFFLSPAVMEEMFSLELPNEHSNESSSSNCVSVSMDNSLSPSHTIIQVHCQDHKGLLYDTMRTLKDYNIQVSYGRFAVKGGRSCDLELFVMQADGKKIFDSSKQKALCSRLRMELFHPLRVAVVTRGPDTELLVANPVDLSGKGRPLVIYDITFALKMLGTCIFSAEIGRHVIGDREWEVYRILLGEGDSLSVSWEKIKTEVMKMLMGWE
ncbi:hypothetical protein Syun_016328 [Stephania yunnanensis]|uniref:ACT domain-containing protein ACR n=1 Tax=Stephania yunnanensis TaxID=152371 RepID=A0AAP0J7B2_9MAGN